MEAVLHFAHNADSEAEVSYLRNLPILKVLQQENVEVTDWDELLASAPSGEDSLFWCLGYAGTLCALDATDFDSWFVYCLTVVDSALEACKLKMRPMSVRICWRLAWRHGRSTSLQTLSQGS